MNHVLKCQVRVLCIGKFSVVFAFAFDTREIDNSGNGSMRLNSISSSLTVGSVCNMDKNTKYYKNPQLQRE